MGLLRPILSLGKLSLFVNQKATLASTTDHVLGQLASSLWDTSLTELIFSLFGCTLSKFCNILGSILEAMYFSLANDFFNKYLLLGSAKGGNFHKINLKYVTSKTGKLIVNLVKLIFLL